MTKGLLTDEEKKTVTETSQPKWASPMLATPTKDHFSDENWIYERKLDGERCLRNGRRMRLMSRNKKELNGNYPEIVDASGRQDAKDFIADGAGCPARAFTGSSQSSWRRSGSPNGPATQSCGIHDSSVCAATRSRGKS